MQYLNHGFCLTCHQSTILKNSGVATSLQNYYILNDAQIINGTLNVNETLQEAENKLKEI